VHFDVCKLALSNHVLDRVNEIGRTLDRDDFSGRADEFGKIDRRVPWTRADIEHFAAGSNAGFFPAIQNDRSPGAMLHTEPLELGFMRAKDIIAFFGRIHRLANKSTSRRDASTRFLLTTYSGSGVSLRRERWDVIRAFKIFRPPAGFSFEY
jgi:hypothetical protein